MSIVSFTRSAWFQLAGREGSVAAPGSVARFLDVHVSDLSGSNIDSAKTMANAALPGGRAK